MLKRAMDIVVSLFFLVVLSPVLVPLIVLVWLQDRQNPFYIASRVGKHEALFKMVKLRTMIVGAEKKGVDSTAAGDSRITRVGHFIRKYKLDELSQLWNVLKGDMSLVGPRPNVQRETDLYTPIEKHLLEVKPGITDFSSIIFSDEAEILEGHNNPDITYNQLIRPGKSSFGLFYIEHCSVFLDVQLCFLTVVAICSRRKALTGIQKLLSELGADSFLVEIASRKEKLVPMPPPGSDTIVTSRNTQVHVED